MRMEAGMPRMIEIVTDYLKAHGYDGVCHPGSECGCFLDDLIPCGDNCCMDCKPGHRAMIDGIEVCVAADDTPNAKAKGAAVVLPLPLSAADTH